ncbi:MAG TPA: SpoIVB peptidase S55 domain-containing protein [Capsulimonadaceae bacterium]|jgi:hypothetical protein
MPSRHSRLPVHRLRVCALVAATATIVGAVSPVYARPAVPVAKPAPEHRQKFDTTRFVPESELKHGQKGYALTVFHGQKIERFDVMVLGVLKKINNGKDLILIKVMSGPSVTRQANIAHGMSGSPVYVGKRMIGAIAYSMPFAREPIGLVTPIGDMLEAWDPDLPSKPSLAMTPGSFGAPVNAAIAVNNSLLAPYLGQSALSGSLQGSTNFVSLATPLMISGMSSKNIAKLGPLLTPYGLMPMAGGGAGPSRKPTAKDYNTLVPGGAVGVSVVQGDIDMTAIGTLTYRDGNRVIAFGHPFTGIGPIDAAMTTATITDLFPSIQDSMKLGAPDVTVGRIFQDRPFSVGGLIGSPPQMIPVSIHIDDQSDKRVRTFNARVINHPLLTSRLVLSVVDEAILQTHGTPGDAIANVKIDVDAEQVGHVVRTNVFYDPLSIGDTAITDLANLMGLFSANPFYPIAVRSVKFDITIQSKHDTAQIDHIYVPKVKYEPGDTVDVGVIMKPYKQEPVRRTVSLTIPQSTPNGAVVISVRGGTPTLAELLGLRSATSAPPTNVNQMVRKFLEQPKNNDLVATLQLPTTALNIQGEKLSLLPPNLSAIMRAQHSTGLRLERDEVKVLQKQPFIVSGAQNITIVVARKNPLDTAPPPSATPAPPPTQVPQDGVSAIVASEFGDYSLNTASTVADPSASLTPASVQPESATLTPEPRQSTPPAPIARTAAAVVVLPPSAAAGGDDDDDSDGPEVISTPSTPAKKVTPVSRVAQSWRQDTNEIFAGGTLENVALTSANDLRLAASPAFFAASTASYIWSLTADAKGNVFAGTGDDGVVYKTAPDGTMTPFYRTGELEVTSLTLDRQSGALYAGTAPHGILFRITPDGKGEKIFTADEKYITALALDQTRGKLYIATSGGTGRIYAAPLASPADAKPLWTSQASHIVAMAVDSKGTIYASGAPDGLVYSITPTGQGSIVFTTATQNVTALAVGKDDVLYAGTSPRGALVKITPVEGAAPDVKQLLTKVVAPIYGMQADKDGNVWAVGGNSLYSIAPDDTLFTHTAATDVQFITVALADTGAVYAGTSDIGQIYALGDHTQPVSAKPQGTFTSSVHDAKLPSKWGAITWDSTTPEGTSIVVQTRSGDVQRPDATWSAWEAPTVGETGKTVASPAARYIQYRALFTGRGVEPTGRATLSSVTIYYLSRNQAPFVKLLAPVAGEAVSGDYMVRWAGSDPDKDTLAYDLFSSSNGTDWTLIKQVVKTPDVKPVDKKPVDAKPATDTKPVAPAKPAPATPAPANPKAVKPAVSNLPPPPPPISANPPQVARQAGPPQVLPGETHVVPVTPPKPGVTSPEPVDAPKVPATPVTPPAHVMTTSQSWSTAKLPDGRYWLKVSANDLPSNATGNLSADSTIGPIIVDNTPPTVTLDASTPVDDKKQATVTGSVTGKLAFITAVQYKVDDQSNWSAAAAASGLFDSINERFSLTTSPLTAGAHKITVQAVNQAGNNGTATVTVTVTVP